MPVSADQLLRAREELARGDTRLRTELRRERFKDVRHFLSALQHTLETVAIHEEVSKARRAAWKILRALRVEGD